MTNQEYVVKLYNREKELIKICNYYNVIGQDCEDIIQNLYVIILNHKNIDRYLVDGDINMYIIFAILKNNIIYWRKKNNRFKIYDIETLWEENDELCNYIEEENINLTKYDFMLSEINNIDYWFDKIIIQLYIQYNHTIRSLSKETNISKTTIQKIVHNFKVKCQDNWKNQI